MGQQSYTDTFFLARFSRTSLECNDNATKWILSRYFFLPTSFSSLSRGNVFFRQRCIFETAGQARDASAISRARPPITAALSPPRQSHDPFSIGTLFSPSHFFPSASTFISFFLIPNGQFHENFRIYLLFGKGGKIERISSNKYRLLCVKKGIRRREALWTGWLAT